MRAKTCFQRRRHGRFLTFALCLCAPSWASAQLQTPDRKNSVYMELVGSGYGITLNFERVLTSRISARAGGGIAADGKPSSGELTIGAPPVPNDYSILAATDVAILGRRHQLFAGAGARILWINYGYKPQETKAGVFGELGYRYQSKSGFFLKATLVASSGEWEKDYPLWAYPGVSLGWSF